MRHGVAAAARRGPVRAGLYVRISDDKAGDELGVRRQEHDCRELARRLGWSVADVYPDNSVSAYSGPRPTYERLLDDLASGRIDGLLAYHPDRLYRSLPDLEGLIDAIEARGAQVATVAAGEIDLGSASGRAMARTLGVMARYESERKAERQVSKHEELARDGKPSGGPAAYGYRWVDRPSGERTATGRVKQDLVLDPDEAEVVREAAERVLGGELISHVVADLRARGVTSRGHRLRSENVVRVLTSGRIAGLRERDGATVGPAVWPAIVTTEQHHQLRGILRDPTRARTRPFTSSLLGGGLARCGRCGAPLHAGRARPTQAQRAAGQQGPRVYKCEKAKTEGACGRLQVNAEHVEAIAVADLFEALSGEGLAKAVARRVPDGSAAQAELEAIEAKLAALGARWAEGTITDAAFDAAQATLKARMDDAQGQLGASRRGEVLRRFKRLPDLQAAWPQLSLADRRTALALVLDSVVVGPTTRPGRTFDPSRVTVQWRA